MGIFNKKAQGLSLTTIIVAAIALIVLVILVMIFTGRIGIFSKGVGQAGQAELATLRLSYDDCRPSPSHEATFTAAMEKAESDIAKEDARRVLKSHIDRCGLITDKITCEGTSGCAWK